ncbi:hypothetical protein VV02_07190 [Luteipulveratus mongoliensis]|uniref:Cell envelope-related transcriptional attenuator domain-containing protein n=1 Tax=Luteipulveratus mongoliensis TaxID=571913 RepID=A0A0K1JPT3_9MICO|nr:hypothetical protein VV02_07190 [Luteipulveratus mongoliensis]
MPDGEEPLPRRRGRRRKKSRSKLKIVIYTLIAMFAVVVFAVAGFALYLNHLLDSNVRRSGLLPPNESRLSRATTAGNSQNILLLGSDSRTEDLGDSSRADVIQLVHVSDDRKTVQVIHFPRDLYVDIPGHRKNKINAAYALGGAPLLVQTMEGMLDVPIDHVAQIGFDGFKDLTNTVGGVDVNVDQATTSGHFTFTEGINHMKGDAALAFVRERHQLSEGDISRGKRQQAWIKALLTKSLKRGTLSNPTRLASMIDDTTKNLVVDNAFSTGKMRDLGFSLRGLRSSGVTFLTAPFTGFDTVNGIGSVDTVDQTKMKQLGDALRTDKVKDLPNQIANPG